MTRDRSRKSSRVHVLFSFSDGPAHNPYIPLLINHIESHADTACFTWKTALLKKYDVFHIHWPEALIRDTTVSKSRLKQLLTLLLLVKLRVSGVAIIRTLHNATPHESGSAIELYILTLIDRMTSKFITMSDCDVDPRYTPSVRIPHPDYRPLTRDCDELEKPKEPGLIIYFGLIRPYKNVEHLAEVFSQLESQDLNLEITGFTESKCLIESIETTAEKDSRVTFRNVFLSDRELYSEISRATLVVLPYTRLLNSGAALLALSLRRPVLVPETCAMRELANEVGRDWVQMYAGTLTAAHLEAAVDSVADLDPNDAPNLTARTWTACAAATYRVYCGA